MNPYQINEWYERYKTGIFRYALSILKDSALAEDVLQETFLKLLTGKYTIQEDKAQAWLYKVARNLCYDILRNRNREQEVRIAAVMESYAYIDLIASLDLSEREIVTLKIVGGLTHKEIAKIMGLTEHAAKKRYERAIHKLREEEV